jgi:hypothetical protein
MSSVPEIDYCAIVRNGIIIASYGDSAVISERDLLKLMPIATSQPEQRISSAQLFTFVATPGLTFVTVSRQSVDKNRPIFFLDALSRRWAANFGPVSASSRSHGLDTVFADNFGSLFNEFSNPGRVSSVSKQLQETHGILKDSVEKVFDRTADLRSLSSKSETLRAPSDEFRSEGANSNGRMRWQYIKCGIMWIFLLLLIVSVVLTWICGGFLLKRCRSK